MPARRWPGARHPKPSRAAGAAARVRPVRGAASGRDHDAADSRAGSGGVVQPAVEGSGGPEATLQELTEEIRGLMAGKPPRDAGPGLSARRLGHPRREAAAGQSFGARRCRRVVVRRPVRLGRSQAEGTGHHAVPGQRPAGSEAVARRHLDHLRGRSQRHRAVRAAAVDAPHPKRSGVALDGRRLCPRDRSGPGVGSRDSAKPVGIQGRNGQPRRRRRRPDGSATSGCVPTTASPSGRSAVRIRPFASSGCSSSSGTAPNSPSRRGSSAAARSAARRWA